MFTGIVKGVFKVSRFQKLAGMVQLCVKLPPEMLKDLKVGASISINGVCLTVVRFDDHEVWFDIIEETLTCSNLKRIGAGSFVNVERAAKWGDEIGGHSLSGHVFGEILIERIAKSANNTICTFSSPQEWIRYLIPKGYIAIDGISLTLGKVCEKKNEFTVHLIPETLRMTTLGLKKEGDWVNIEFDSQTQTIVDTIERLLSAR